MRLYKKTALAVFLMLSFSFVHAADATKTVEAVNLEKTALNGQTVIIQGHVTKVNNGIMKRNFIHLEDGTGSGETAHLIITSAETAKVGDNVLISTPTLVLATYTRYWLKKRPSSRRVQKPRHMRSHTTTNTALRLLLRITDL